MSAQILQVDNSPNQTFTANLTVDGGPLTLQLTLRYNEVADYWCMTVEDANGDLLLDSIPLVTGNDPACNILRQYSYLEIGSAYVINTSGSLSPNYPNNTNLGSGFSFLWADTP